MDLSTDLASHLRNLAESVGAGDESLTGSLAALVVDLRTAVSSYVGLRLTLVLDEWPITFTSFSSLDGERPMTSLRLTMSDLGGAIDPDSHIVFYAGTPGAFVDLAADLTYVYRRSRAQAPDEDQGTVVALDIDLPPVTLVSGSTGLTEYTTINRAVGLLIGRGKPPDQAREALHQGAAARGLHVHLYAAHLLDE